jgi:hypothetical protein
LLVSRGLVAVEAAHALLGVTTHLELVHDRVLKPAVALGALPCRAHEGRVRLVGLHPLPLPVDEERPQDEREPDDDRDEH